MKIHNHSVLFNYNFAPDRLANCLAMVYIGYVKNSIFQIYNASYEITLNHLKTIAVETQNDRNK